MGQRDDDHEDVSALAVAGAVSASSSQKSPYNTYYAGKQTCYGEKRDLSYYGALPTAVFYIVTLYSTFCFYMTSGTFFFS